MTILLRCVIFATNNLRLYGQLSSSYYSTRECRGRGQKNHFAPCPAVPNHPAAARWRCVFCRLIGSLPSAMTCLAASLTPGRPRHRARRSRIIAMAACHPRGWRSGCRNLGCCGGQAAADATPCIVPGSHRIFRSCVASYQRSGPELKNALKAPPRCACTSMMRFSSRLPIVVRPCFLVHHSMRRLTRTESVRPAAGSQGLATSSGSVDTA
jgi:hypothetical protein